MYKAIRGGSVRNASGRIFRFNAGDTVPARRGELDHSRSLVWIGEQSDRQKEQTVVPSGDSSTDYNVSEVKDMAEDMTDDQLQAFIEGDERVTVQRLL